MRLTSVIQWRGLLPGARISYCFLLKTPMVHYCLGLDLPFHLITGVCLDIETVLYSMSQHHEFCSLECRLWVLHCFFNARSTRVDVLLLLIEVLQ